MGAVAEKLSFAALPHESPTMSAAAVGDLDGNTFAEKLERAIERSASARPIKLIEAKPTPTS
jgi:hypothetical protein